MQPAAGLDDRHPDRALLEGGAEARLGLGQRALGLDALVHVAGDHLRLARLAVHAHAGLGPHGAPVAADEADRGADVVGLARAVAHGEHDREVLGEDELVAGGGRAAPPARSRAPGGRRRRRA